jgi:hypothetical protein
LIQAMSSPIVVTFQPPSAGGGISIAKLVLPQALGKAAGDVVLPALGRGDAEDQHVLGEPARVAVPLSAAERPITEAMRRAKHFLPSRALPP